MNKIESLALAISKTCGAFDPASEAFHLNNPGLLRAFSPKHQSEGRYRKFLSWQAGFKALCFDLLLKCEGKSRAKLEPSAPVSLLLKLWEIKDPRKTITFLQRALKDESISEHTPVEYFCA